jgi:hypothetical protein
VAMPLSKIEKRYEAQPETFALFKKWAKQQIVQPGASLWRWLTRQEPAAADDTQTTPEIEAAAAAARATREALAGLKGAALTKAVKQHDAALAVFHAAVEVPKKVRLLLPMAGSGAEPVRDAAAAAILAKWVSPAYLQGTARVELWQGVRSKYVAGVLAVTADAAPVTVAHEWIHHLEARFPEVLKAARRFLFLRADGDAPVALAKLMKGYEAGEFGFEDEWLKKGGALYAGKLYGQEIGTAPHTEILTEGLERLEKDALLFYEKDRAWFWMVISTLQQR